MLREIILDTETTGLDPLAGHRLVEVGCVEVVNYIPTGQTFHRYINPERDMPPEAFRVHGLSAEFLSQHPVFRQVVDEFLAFIGDAPLVIHNAEFDLKFLNAELARLKRPVIPSARATDTVKLAKRQFPGARVNLDALCQRFGINITHRDFHGALKDADLLAQVYLELRGGRQPDFVLPSEEKPVGAVQQPVTRTFRPPRSFVRCPLEESAHRELLARLTDPLWLKAS